MPWMPEVFTAPIAEARRVQEEGRPQAPTTPSPTTKAVTNGTGGAMRRAWSG
jgi:hypothetical protein